MSAVQHRLRPRHRKDPERLHRGQCAASACAGRTSAGRSSCGRRTCSTRTTSRSRSTRRCRAAGTERGRRMQRLLSPRSTQLFGAFLGRAADLRPDASRQMVARRARAPAVCRAAAAAAAAAAGNADLPGRIGDPGDGHLPAAAAAAATCRRRAGAGPNAADRIGTEDEGPRRFGGALFLGASAATAASASPLRKRRRSRLARRASARRRRSR